MVPINRMVFFRTFFLSWVFCLLISGSPAWSEPVEEMPGLLKRIITKNHGYGGGVIRISDRRGLIWEGAAGLVAGPDSATMETDTPFEIASVTKMVTAATVLKFVETGKIRLDARLADCLDRDQAKGFEAVTIRQLLTHTSGLPDYWSDGSRRKGFLQAFLAEPRRTWRPPEILAYAREMRRGIPGKRFSYSDTNYVLLGLVIERAAKAPLHQAFREMIFAPLGMNDTWMSYREKARGPELSHRFEGVEDLHAVPRQSADWAGGGLVSTTRDLEKLLRGMVSGGLFKNADTLDIMREAVPTGEDGITYGKGIYRVELDRGQGELWGHDGHGNAFAYYWPERGLFFTGTLNQTRNDWWPLVEPFLVDPRTGIRSGAESRTFSAGISTGWDSLYMFRGVNALRGGSAYGSGIGWTAVNLAWNPDGNDTFSLDSLELLCHAG
ncbi:MAG: serine hydrolase domain-containing protein [Terrimicrobiaceae bacterium]